jgi:hypothetical protein
MALDFLSFVLLKVSIKRVCTCFSALVTLGARASRLVSYPPWVLGYDILTKLKLTACGVGVGGRGVYDAKRVELVSWSPSLCTI